VQSLDDGRELTRAAEDEGVVEEWERETRWVVRRVRACERVCFHGLEGEGAG
jgi:hypothetical protein